jgi:hypothetical protein
MSNEDDESLYRSVLLFRETQFCQAEHVVLETSLYRSNLGGNFLLEQRLYGRRETTTSVVVLNGETIKRLLLHFERLDEE